MKAKSIIAASLSALLVFGVFALSGCSTTSNTGKNTNANVASSTLSTKIPDATKTFTDDELLSGIHHAQIVVEGYDPINVELDADAAPITVTNFVNLANDGYYDGLTFYRVVEDFCLQGGTLGNTASGDDPSIGTITGEFSSNNIENPLAETFTRGTIAMARSSLPNSASSTFFITLGADDIVGASLNGQYAAFGMVDDNGMKVVDQIVDAMLPFANTSNMGVISDEAEQPVIKSITID